VNAPKTVPTAPSVSIVVPVHNKRQHVSRSIESVLAQDYDDFELIVIDDASTDGSAEEIAKFLDARLRTFHRSQPGPGGYAARNLGIAEAKAQIVAFLDADDEWLPNHLATLMNAFQEMPEATIAGTGYLDSGSSCVVDRYTKNSGSNCIHRVTLSDYVSAYGRGRNAFRTSALAAPREALLTAGGFPENRCVRGGDIDTWIRLLALGDGLRSQAVTAIYHRDSVNMVTRNSKGVEAPTCSESTLLQLKRQRSGLSFAFQVDRLIQYLRRLRLARLARQRPIRLTDLRGLSPIFSPRFYCGLLTLALLPDRIASQFRRDRGPLSRVFRSLLRVRYR
jgi:glycosyltransferase involved in cell wall biosynthesis